MSEPPHKTGLDLGNTASGLLSHSEDPELCGKGGLGPPALMTEMGEINNRMPVIQEPLQMEPLTHSSVANFEIVTKEIEAKKEPLIADELEFDASALSDSHELVRKLGLVCGMN